MGATSGRESASVKSTLLSEPYRFDFFQAARAWQAFCASDEAAKPDAGRGLVGEDVPPARESLRFRAASSLSFAAAHITEVRLKDPSLEMVLTFMGLTGPNGVLPHHYTALLIEQRRAKGEALGDFLDIFNHRLISLFYRAWEKCRFPISYERSKRSKSPLNDRYTEALLSLIGLGSKGLRERLDIDDELLLYYAGSMTHASRCAVSLEAMLSDFFGVACSIEQFHGQWLEISPSSRSRLPGKGDFEANTRLGESVVLGERVWDVQSKFRVRLGPLGYGRFCGLIPGGNEFKQIMKFIRFYVGPEFDFEIQPVLLAAEVPGCHLGRRDQYAQPALGRNVWIRSPDKAFARDFEGAVFNCGAI